MAEETWILVYFLCVSLRLTVSRSCSCKPLCVCCQNRWLFFVYNHTASRMLNFKYAAIVAVALVVSVRVPLSRELKRTITACKCIHRWWAVYIYSVLYHCVSIYWGQCPCFIRPTVTQRMRRIYIQRMRLLLQAAYSFYAVLFSFHHTHVRSFSGFFFCCVFLSFSILDPSNTAKL